MPSLQNPLHDDTWQVSVLGGPLVLDPMGSDISLTPLQRALVTMLALSYPRPRSVDSLVDAMWPDGPPRTARAALHNQVSRLRSATDSQLIVKDAQGYRLGVSPDVHLASRVTRTAESELRAGGAEATFHVCDHLLSRWSAEGDSKAWLHIPHVERRRLEEIHTTLQLLRLEAALAMDHVRWACTEGERMVAHDPLDEARWVLLVKAFRLSGRRGDALGAIGRARSALGHQLGISIGEQLQELERLILEEGEPVHAAAKPFVGRLTEMEMIHRALAAGQSVLVTGDRGIGKTRLIHHLRSQLRSPNITLVAARCEVNPGTAMSLINEIIEQIGETWSETSDYFRQFVSVLHRHATSRKMILLVDDIHLAGPTTLRSLIEVSSISGVDLVATSTTDSQGLLSPLLRNQWSFVELSPLNSKDIRESLGLSDDPDDKRCDWLAEMSGGNPLLADLIHEANHFSSEWQAGLIPERVSLQSIESLVSQRLLKLSDSALRAVEIAALIGDTTLLEFVERAASKEGLHGAIASSILFEKNPRLIGFRYPAFRQVVETLIPTGRRAELHQLIAESLPGHLLLDKARHHLASEGIDLEGTSIAVFAAAEEASASGAHRESADLFEDLVTILRRRLGVSDHLTIRAEIRLGDALRLAGDPSHIDQLQRSAHMAQDSADHALITEAALAFVQLGGASNGGPHASEALRIVEIALATLDGEDHAIVSAAMCSTLVLFVDPERARSVFLDAASRARTRAARQIILPNAYLSLGHPDDLDLREEMCRELTMIAETTGSPRTRFSSLHQTFSNAIQRGDGAAARRSLDGLGWLVPIVGDIGRRWEHLYCSAAVAHLDGDLEIAEQLSERAHDLFAPVAPDRAAAAHLSQMLMIRLHQGRHDEMVEPLRELCRRQPFVRAWPALLAGIVIDSEPGLGLELARQALQQGPRDFTWLPRLLVASRAAVLVANQECARAYYETLRPYSGLVAWQGTCAFGIVDQRLSELAQVIGLHAEATKHFEAGLLTARSLGAPVFAH